MAKLDSLEILPLRRFRSTGAAAADAQARRLVHPLGRLVKSPQRHGIASTAGVGLAPLLRAGTKPLDAAAARALEQHIDQMTEALEASAAPAAEWPAMREVFGSEMLADLLEVSASSLKRYAAAERATPAQAVARLHWLTMVVADLAGAYNNFGIRRWFERPRAQLGGVSPRALLGRRWQVDGPGCAPGPPARLHAQWRLAAGGLR